MCCCSRACRRSRSQGTQKRGLKAARGLPYRPFPGVSHCWVGTELRGHVQRPENALKGNGNTVFVGAEWH